MNNKILDFFLIQEKGNPTLDESAELVNKAANGIKVIPQLISVVTMCVAVTGLVLNLLHFEKGTQMYNALMLIFGLIACVYGFKLEKTIEAVFCHPIRILRDGEFANNKTSFFISSFVVILLVGLSFGLTMKGKTASLVSTFKSEKTDFASMVNGLAGSFGLNLDTKETSDKISQCEKDIVSDYNARIEAAKNKAKDFKEHHNKTHLEVTVVNRLKSEMRDEINKCKSKHDSEYSTKKEGIAVLNNLAGTIIESTEKNNKTIENQNKELQTTYDDLLSWAIWICVPLSLLLYVLKVVNEKK